MKLTYSYSNDKLIFGKFENLLNAAKSFSDIKIGLGTNEYEEIIPFNNIAYTDDFVIGFQPNHTSSYSSKIFNSKKVKYTNYKVFFLYSSNKDIGIFKSGLNSETMLSYFGNVNYKYYNWYEKNLDCRFKFKSSIDFNDNKKKEKLITEIRDGYNVKIRYKLDGINYILSPTIKYFNINNIKNSLSIKTNPIIDIAEIYKNKRFFLKEFFFNVNGDVSILKSKEYFLKFKKYNFLKLINFILSRLSNNFNLSKNEISIQNILKQDIDFYIF